MTGTQKVCGLHVSIPTHPPNTSLPPPPPPPPPPRGGIFGGRHLLVYPRKKGEKMQGHRKGVDFPSQSPPTLPTPLPPPPPPDPPLR